MDELNNGDKSVELEGLGLRLKNARENKGLSIDSVAHQLNISQQRILDMENNDYRFAVAESYAKGFLRSYANFLGLDSALIINEFDRMKYGDTIQHQTTKLIVKRQASASDSWMRWLTYSIAILLVVLVGIWWQNQPNHSDVVTAAGSPVQSTTDISSQVAPKVETTINTTDQTQKSDPQTTQLLQDSPGTDQTNTQTVTSSASSSTTGTENTTTTQSPPSVSNSPDSTQAPAVSGSNATGTENTSSVKLKPAESNQINTTPAPANNGSSTTSTPQTQSDASETESTDAEDSGEEESDDEELDDEPTDGQQGFNTIKKLKPKVILGQREKDERALLMELEKIFGRG